MTEQATTRLYALDEVFDFSESHRQLFVDSMREMAVFHMERSAVFRGICHQLGFRPESVTSLDAVAKIPHIFVTAFKEHKLLSLPESEIFKTFTSSGTQGQKSQINLDKISFERQSGMRERIVRAMGITSTTPANCMVFSYAPDIAGERGAAHTFNTYTTFSPAQEKYFALQAGAQGEAEFDLEKAIATLQRFEATGAPLRVIGFLAFSYVTFKEMKARGLRLRFPAESLLVTGGGWKSHKGETVTFEEYAALVSDVLGINRDRIRDFYGMVEHGVPYVSCSHQHFHVPIYGHVRAIHPGTLQALPHGEPGLLKLQTSYVRSAPSISVLSTDVGAVHQNCPCGVAGDYLVLRGRAGVTKHAGCAISASQLIKI